MADIAADKAVIRELVENWVLWRDARLWDRFRTVWHADGRMMATWFQGSFEDFIKANDEGWARGVRILHFLGGSAIGVAGDRAIAQTKMTISQRAPVEGVVCDVVCTGRFYDFFERRDGRWGLVLRQPIYEKDRIDPVDPSAEARPRSGSAQTLPGRLPPSRLSANQGRLPGEARHARHRGGGTRRPLRARSALAERKAGALSPISATTGDDLNAHARHCRCVLLGAGAAVTFIGVRLIERAHPPRGRFIEIDGLRQHVVELGEHAGAADAPPIVLLHGAGCNLEDMRLALGERLAARYRVILLDRPGLGWSERRGGEGSSPTYQAAMLNAVLDRLDVDRAIVVGHSWGGLLALTFALDYPQRVAGLVVIAPPTHPWLGHDDVAQFGICASPCRMVVRPHADAAAWRPADRTGFSRRVSAAIVAARLHEALGGAPAAAAGDAACECGRHRAGSRHSSSGKPSATARSPRRPSSSPAIATRWSRRGTTRCGSPPPCRARGSRCCPASAICCTTPPPTGRRRG